MENIDNYFKSNNGSFGFSDLITFSSNGGGYHKKVYYEKCIRVTDDKFYLEEHGVFKLYKYDSKILFIQ